jgi:hypothetical protein
MVLLDSFQVDVGRDATAFGPAFGRKGVTGVTGATTIISQGVGCNGQPQQALRVLLPALAKPRFFGLGNIRNGCNGFGADGREVTLPRLVEFGAVIAA